MSDPEAKTPATTEPTVDQEEKKATESEEAGADVDKVRLIHVQMIYDSLCVLTLTYFQELEAMKARVKMMEEEAAKLREMQAEVEKSMNPEEGEREFRSPSK